MPAAGRAKSAWCCAPDPDWRVIAVDALSLSAVGDEQLAAATAARAGRAAHTLYGGRDHALRQTVLALAAGHGLDDHESPGEATLLVLRGQYPARHGNRRR